LFSQLENDFYVLVSWIRTEWNPFFIELKPVHN
jgi:hypothetical protein